MTIRVATDEDLPAIMDLLAAAFPRHPRSAAHWKWWHAAGRGLALVAERHGEIIGHYSFGFQPFRLGAQRITAGYGSQAAIHPRHRDLRTIVELVQAAERRAAEDCQFVFTFPNARMAPLKERLLSWRRVREVAFWELSLPGYRENVGRRDSSSAYEIRRMETLRGIDELPPEDCPPERLAPVMDVDYLQWRYVDHPSQHYAVYGAFANEGLVALTVLKVFFNGTDLAGHPVRIVCGPGHAEAKTGLLRAAGDYFDYMGVSRVVTWNECVDHQSLFSALGFQPTGNTTNLYAKGLDPGMTEIDRFAWSFDLGTSDNV